MQIAGMQLMREPEMDGVSVFWLHIHSDFEKFCSASAPPRQIIEIFNSDCALTLQFLILL